MKRLWKRSNILSPIHIAGVTLALEVGDFIDLPKERGRLVKEIAAHEVDILRTA